MNRLSDRTIVVTGAASGIGRACAVRSAEAGAAVVVADRDMGGALEVASAISSAGGQAQAFEVDVTDTVRCEEMADFAVESFGGLDGLIAAAGISAASQPGDPLDHDGLGAGLSWSTEVWHRVLDINLDGLMYCNRAVARHMIASGSGGSIVNIASISSAWTSGNATAYSVSKSGAWMLTKALSIELAEYGIRVNAVGPGFTETPMTATTRADDSASKSILERTPLGRFGRPEEIADSAVFLSSGEASFVTGTILYVDGGFNAYAR
ncbi:SDR family NAD(P)-dependent oxidoreductase [Prescottella defluvii]|uniref:SDR family NAD(P)-dependent oxidoreductase n=1 Tax=Prescottella defluvii TaxID=1323361 RepID=UPI0004F3A755|nr:SDR family NAD(P)-dependent oxidoreductase [Prescottella defluvii]